MSVWKHSKRTKSAAWKDLAIIAVVAAVIFIVAAWFDSFERFAAWSGQYNSWQVNEVATVLVFLAFALAIFSWRRLRELKAEVNRRQEYHNLFRLANDPILIFDAAEATVLDVNDKACEVYGIAWEKFIGRSIDEITQDPAGARRRLDQVRNKGKLGNFEAVHVGADGSPIYFLINQSLIEYQGRQAILSIDRDITERRHSEDELRKQKEIFQRIFDHIPVMINFTGADGGINLVNREWERILGWSLEEIQQQGVDAFAESYPDPQYREEVLNFIASAEGKWVDFKTRIRDGRTIDTTWARVKLSDGTTIGIGKDITERKQAETRSATFANLARKLSGARVPLDAAQIIVDTANELFGWDSCTLDLYDADEDLVHPVLHLDIIDGRRVDVTPFIAGKRPTAKSRRVIQEGARVTVREAPYEFDQDSVPFGDEQRPSASIMGVPIRQSSKVIGILSIYSYTPRAYDNESLNDLQALAEHCGEALNRIQAGAALCDSEERYRDLVENSRDLICTHDLEGRILSANKAALGILGYDPKDYVGKKNLRDILAPEVRNQFEDYLTRIRRDGVASGLMRVQTSSGERRIWEYYNTLRTEGVATPIVRGMAHDITERNRAEEALRESEERYRELFENARDAIYVHDLSGKYTSLNRAAEKLSGYTRGEILGKNFANFIAPEHLRSVRENLCRKLGEEGQTIYEVEVIAKDGRRVPVEVSSRLIYENGVAAGVQGTARDITERKRAQEALRTYSRRLIEAQEEERQRIARELHDQIGQVLTAVRINLDTVQRLCETPAVLAHVEDSVRVLDEALDQVRNLSLDLRPSLLDDLGLVTALRWYANRQAKRTGVRTEVLTEYPDHSVRFSRELETACFRIAQEALTNVTRHAQAKRVSVQLQKDQADLLLIIKDDGEGFDVDSLRQRAVGGSTLGLLGMEERAHAVGGVIEIDSAPSKGTEIRCRFPIKTRS